MIEYQLDTEHSILTVHPKSALSEDDFTQMTNEVDAHIAATGDLAGIVIDAPAFPGWNSFGAMVHHIRFVHDHHKHVQRVALVTDSHIGDVAQHVMSHFVTAAIRHFPSQESEQAREWVGNAPAADSPTPLADRA